MTVKTFIILQKISISVKCCYFEKTKIWYIALTQTGITDSGTYTHTSSQMTLHFYSFGVLVTTGRVTEELVHINDLIYDAWHQLIINDA